MAAATGFTWHHHEVSNPAEPTTDAEVPRVPIAPPVRRLVCVAVAAWAGLLTASLLVGSQLKHPVFAAITFAVQAAFVVCVVWQARPAAPWISVAAGVASAGAADWFAVYKHPLSLTPLAYIVAGAFGFVLVAQLFGRRGGREWLTESFATAMACVVGVVALAMPIVMSRHPGGGKPILAGALLAAGTAVIVARMSDATLPLPRIAPHVARGAFGIVLGSMVGTAVSAYSGVLLQGPSPARAAVAGLVVSVTAVLADLGATYINVGRRLAGENVAPWPVRHALGPLLAFAFAAPMAYLIGVLYLARGL